jgi:hypothetical protein
MALKKKPDQLVHNTTLEEVVIAKSKHSLVFVSHDTRDAEIAEAFSKLLSSVTMGILKSFRSSDRKGSQGIEYGVEWYPEIMKKLDEASDIVCLLTQHSVDRPWILYEAGVAKGKLNTTVLGIAIGIPLNNAANGPFAQFQNCGDDEDSLTKLVLQLARRIPNADPDEDIVKEQVKLFKSKVTELLKSQPQITNKPSEITEDTSIAKLFEEVKIMFKDLPYRIDKHLDPELINRRKRRFHPMIFEEFMHFGGKKEDSLLSFLIFISFLREDIPWLYEVGIETYRTLKTAKTKADKLKAISSFENTFEMVGHPMMREMYGRHDELFFNTKEITHHLHRILSRVTKNESAED